MLKKAIMVLSLMYIAGLVFAWSTPSLILAQEDEYYYEDDTYVEDDFYYDDSEAEDEFFYDNSEFDDDFYDDFGTTLYDDTGVETIDYSDPGEIWAFMVSYMLFLCCLTLPMYIFASLILYTIGKKVGEDSAWMAWVPLLNLYYMVKVADLSGWMFILFFIPFVNFFFGIYVWMEIFKRRGFNEWLALLTLIPIANFIILAYVAWGESDGGTSTETVSVTESKDEEVVETEKSDNK